MKDFIYNEMMVHIPLCTSKEPKNILIISEKPKALEIEIKKHNNIKCKTIGCKIDFLRDEKNQYYDIVICEAAIDKTIIEYINMVLKKDGLITIKHPPLNNIEQNKKIMKLLADYFKIIMPYNIGNSSTALLASKQYHPTADVVLQRADMIDNLMYYNCDVHIGSFAMGNYIRKEYLGIIKN